MLGRAYTGRITIFVGTYVREGILGDNNIRGYLCYGGLLLGGYCVGI